MNQAAMSSLPLARISTITHIHGASATSFDGWC
jgi:hypothetical protein